MSPSALVVRVSTVAGWTSASARRDAASSHCTAVAHTSSGTPDTDPISATSSAAAAQWFAIWSTVCSRSWSSCSVIHCAMPACERARSALVRVE